MTIKTPSAEYIAEIKHFLISRSVIINLHSPVVLSQMLTSCQQHARTDESSGESAADFKTVTFPNMLRNEPFANMLR